MLKYFVILIFLCSNLAIGFAGVATKPMPSSSFLDSFLKRYSGVNENILAATLIIFLCVLHFFRGKKSIDQKITSADDKISVTNVPTSSNLRNRRTIAIIDDDIFIRESWELFLSEFNLISFDSPESFLMALDRNAAIITALDAIVVDYDFGNKSSISGADLAVILRQKTSAPIILSTDREEKDIQGFDCFDLHLDKNILDWHGLQKLLPAVISQ